jgi:SAM-dependent methyltransferase
MAANVRPPDAWTSGSSYESYVGRWSRAVARDFVQWLKIPPGGRWLDVGCGTGALTETILVSAQPGLVKGVDSSAGFIEFAADRIQDNRAQFEKGDAQALQEPASNYDSVVSALMLNFLPEPRLAVQEMVRVARGGGSVAAYVWDYAGQMELMRHFWDAAAALDPAALDLDEGRRFTLCDPGLLHALFRSAGLQDVQTTGIVVPTVFRDFDDYWSPFLGGQGRAPGYVMSLGEGKRTELRERIRQSLPVDQNGTIALIARAWAIRGTCP